MFKVNNNLRHISCLVLVFILLILNMQLPVRFSQLFYQQGRPLASFLSDSWEVSLFYAAFPENI